MAEKGLLKGSFHGSSNFWGSHAFENKTHGSSSQKNAHTHNFAYNFRRLTECMKVAIGFLGGWGKDPCLNDPLPCGDGNGSGLHALCPWESVPHSECFLKYWHFSWGKTCYVPNEIFRQLNWEMQQSCWWGSSKEFWTHQRVFGISDFWSLEVQSAQDSQDFFLL